MPPPPRPQEALGRLLPILDNPGPAPNRGRNALAGAIVDGWALKEDGPVMIVEYPPYLSHRQQSLLFFRDHFWFCCHCAARDMMFGFQQKKHSLHYGVCHVCFHHPCPECAVGPSRNPADILHTLAGINISRERLIAVAWLCPDMKCQGFARNRLRDVPPPTARADVYYPDVSSLSRNGSDASPWNIFCRGNLCSQKSLILARGQLNRKCLVLNAEGEMLGTWDGTLVVRNGPWMQHLRALERGHTVLRQFLEVTGRRMPEIFHHSVGMRLRTIAPASDPAPNILLQTPREELSWIQEVLLDISDDEIQLF